MSAAFVPFLLAVLFVVAQPSRRTLAGGAVLVYVVDLLLTVGQSLLGGYSNMLGLPVLAVPLPRVVVFLSIATAVWFAYHGGYERIVSVVGNATKHPLFAVVVDNRIGPGLSLRRGLVAAVLGAIVGAGGLVVAGGVSDFLGRIARQGLAGSGPPMIVSGFFWNVGIPPARLPKRWAFEASFLLGVLLVTGPRVRPRDLGNGLVVVFGVQSVVKLLPALLPPFRVPSLFGPSSPLLGPLHDATMLVGIAAAVWLAFHDGLERL